MKRDMATRLAHVQIATVGNELFGPARTLELVKLGKGEGSPKDRSDRAYLFNEVSRRMNLAARAASVTDGVKADREAVNKLSNRERKAWVRAGSPAGVERILSFKTPTTESSHG